MKRLLLLTVVLALSTWASAAHAAAPRPVQRVPVVATWFSNLRPASGQREVLSVQFSRDNHGLAGGRFLAAIRYGRRVVHLTGGTTNRHGIASIAFTVPPGLKGTVLLARTTVVFQGQRYRGSNQATVVR